MIRQAWQEFTRGYAPTWADWLGGIALAFLFVMFLMFVGILELPTAAEFGP